MIKISSQEAKELNKIFKIPYGENGISVHGKSKIKGKSHYLCESKYNLKCINKIRNRAD